MVRVLARHARGHWFESSVAHIKPYNIRNYRPPKTRWPIFLKKYLKL